jgi:hypothetical protein
MNREIHVPLREGAGVRFPRTTRPYSDIRVKHFIAALRFLTAFYGSAQMNLHGSTNMRKLKTIAAAAAMTAAVAMAGLPAWAQITYTINGQPAPQDVAAIMIANGLPAGNYWLDAQGYWGLVGNPEPLGNIHSGSYASRYGSGEQGSNGWSHYDNLSGMSVGGDSNGCYYAGDWSNC